MVDELSKIAKQIEANNEQLPPVHLWNPNFCGDIDIRIAQDGTWYYMNSPIGRARLVKLFSSVIRLDEDGHYYLVTPVEKVRIQVDVAPFVAVSMERETHEGIDYYRFTTKEGYSSLLGKEHPLRIQGAGEEIKPFVHIRANLEALIHRNVYYQMVDEAVTQESEGLKTYGLQSGGIFFPISEAMPQSH